MDHVPPGAFVTLIRVAAVGIVAGWTINGTGQQVDELIRARVEELAATGALEAAGVPIAARQLIPQIYEARAFSPAWRSVAQIDGLLEVIAESYLEGLEPRDYHIDAVRAAREAFVAIDTLPPAERAGVDIMLTDSVIRLGYHLRFGKVDPIALDTHWNLSRELKDSDTVEVIQDAIDSPSMREFAADLIPRPFIYEDFKRALAEYRALAAAGGWPSVPAGVTLRPGMMDERVPALVERLAATGDLDTAAIVDSATTLYDGEIVAGVRRFQQRHGLTTDGSIGPETLSALNVPVEQRIEQIRANLERARWVFYEPEREFLVVNIAGFEMYLVRRGDIVWRSRVQVGQPYRQTPVFSATMTYLVFNPTWTVPPTILINDVLPEVRRDPGYLATRNIDLIDADGARVDPASVDWSVRTGFPHRFVQRAGPANALGRVKFMFPNEYFVYVHDTPSRDLFDRDSRAFSSGCIRVEDPYGLALELLGSGWDRERLDAILAAGRTETVFLDDPMEILLLYWTTQIDGDRRIRFFPDVYSRDTALIAALGEPYKPASTL